MSEKRKDWGRFYSAPLKENWTGRCDTENKERLHERVSFLDLSGPINFPKDRKRIVLLGFQSDEGIVRNQGRPGAKEGPDAIRKALSNLAVSPELAISIADGGSISCQDGDLEEAQRILGEAVAEVHRAGAIPFLMGGGHEMAWGHFLGIEKAIAPSDLAVVNLDAHFDLRPLSKDGQGNSGTSFLQIASERSKNGLPFDYYCLGIQSAGNTESLFKTAQAWKVKTVMAEEFHLGGPHAPLKILEQAVLNHSSLYLSICMDVFSSAYAPGVSAPQPLGIFPWHAIPLLRFLARSGKLIGVDVAETSPPLDPGGQTAKLAALLIVELISNL